MTKVIREPSREIPVSHEADVVVAGGGVAGSAAAAAAARAGLKTVMVERSAIPGGMFTHATQYINDFKNKGGLAAEIFLKLAEAGAHNGKNHYNPFMAVPLMDELLQEAGVRHLYLAQATAPIMNGNAVEGLIIESKSGRTAVKAKIVIDATGDGDIAARAGAGFHIGRDYDGACQAASISHLIMNYTGPEPDKETSRLLLEKVLLGKGKGHKLPFDKLKLRRLVGSCCSFLQGGAHITGADMLYADDLSDALVALRGQAKDIFELLRDNMEGFSKIEFGPFSAIPGVRETRRIECDFNLSFRDAEEGRRFEDGLFIVSHRADIHKCTENEPGIILLDVTPYHIPYRALLPRGLENILVAGRCIGGDHKSLASYRIIADCFAMGEAAAIAAGLALKNRCGLRQFPVDSLVREMVKRGYSR